MAKTVIGISDDMSEVDNAVLELVEEGLSRHDIRVIGYDANDESASGYTIQGSGETVSDLIDTLTDTGMPAEDAQYYAEAARRGSMLVIVDAGSDEKADRAAEVLSRPDAVDIDERAAGWRETGWTGYDADAPLLNAEEQASERELHRARNLDKGEEVHIPVVEEQLQVGKRQVERGGIRVYTHLTERPVEEDVQLHEEHIKVERRPANRPASQADLDSFQEGTMEFTEQSEEPVVSAISRRA